MPEKRKRKRNRNSPIILGHRYGQLNIVRQIGPGYWEILCDKQHHTQMKSSRVRAGLCDGCRKQAAIDRMNKQQPSEEEQDRLAQLEYERRKKVAEQNGWEIIPLCEIKLALKGDYELV